MQKVGIGYHEIYRVTLGCHATHHKCHILLLETVHVDHETVGFLVCSLALHL